MKKIKTCVDAPIQYQIMNIDKGYRSAQDSCEARIGSNFEALDG
jgi:hypothetical protein